MNVEKIDVSLALKRRGEGDSWGGVRLSYYTILVSSVFLPGGKSWSKHICILGSLRLKGRGERERCR